MLFRSEPFRNKGEQIDGSFVLQSETYLLEARWESAKTSAADLHAFHGKLEQKAAWAPGAVLQQQWLHRRWLGRLRTREARRLH